MNGAFQIIILGPKVVQGQRNSQSQWLRLCMRGGPSHWHTDGSGDKSSLTVNSASTGRVFRKLPSLVQWRCRGKEAAVRIWEAHSATLSPGRHWKDWVASRPAPRHPAIYMCSKGTVANPFLLYILNNPCKQNTMKDRHHNVIWGETLRIEAPRFLLGYNKRKPLV